MHTHSKLSVSLLAALFITFFCWPAFSQDAASHVSDSDAQSAVKSTCSTQNGTDMCIFDGPSGNTNSIKIGSGLNYLWYGSPSLNTIVRSTTTGATKQCTIRTSGASPFGITLGPDKRMWFAEFNTGNVGAVTSACKVTEYPLGFSPSDSIDIKLGSDNNLWMSSDYNGIVRITPTGEVTTIPLPDGDDAQPSSLTLGADGNIWFLEANGPCFQGADYTSIGRVIPAGVHGVQRGIERQWLRNCRGS
jgi:streptogramin lyase